MPRLVQTIPKVEITTEEQVITLCNVIAALKIVSFDTETTSVEAHTAKCLLMSMSVPSVPWDTDWGNEKVFGEDFFLEAGSRFVFETSNPIVLPLIHMLGMDGVDVVAHNFKYDAHIVHRHWGFMPGKGGLVFDTMIMDHVINENRSTKKRHGLKECCIDYDIYHGLEPFGSLFKKPPKSVLAVRPDLSPSEYAMETNREIFFDYAATDAYVTMLLFEFLREHLKTEKWEDAENPDQDLTFWDYYLKYEEPFIKSIWTMEMVGAKCEPERLDEYRPKILKRMEEIEGFYATLAGEIVNLNSTPQLRSLFIDKLGFPVVKQTKGGASGDRKPALDKEALEIYQDTYPDIVEPLLEYRKIAKLLGTYVDGLSTHIQTDGRIHGTFNIHVAVTNRLSSSQPNLQNIENADPDDARVLEYDIRKAFVADEGNLLVVCDLDQLEVVITSQITQDENLIKVLLDGLDLHSYTAHLMFGIVYEEMMAAKAAAEPTTEQKALLKLRKAAKTLQFGILYGMGSYSLSGRLGVTEEEAQDYIDQYYVAYPGILQAKNYWTEFCTSNGYVRTLMGRRRRIPEIWNESYKVQARAKRQLFNAIIQGSAADMMRDYMPAIAFNDELQKMGAKLAIQVHDEVVVEVPEKYAEEACPIVEDAMCGSLSFVPWRVPLSAGAKIAKTWSEGK